LKFLHKKLRKHCKEYVSADRAAARKIVAEDIAEESAIDEEKKLVASGRANIVALKQLLNDAKI